MPYLAALPHLQQRGEFFSFYFVFFHSLLFIFSLCSYVSHSVCIARALWAFVISCNCFVPPLMKLFKLAPLAMSSCFFLCNIGVFFAVLETGDNILAFLLKVIMFCCLQTFSWNCFRWCCAICFFA